MELEAKYLAPYLPYGLKLQYVVRDVVERIGVMTKITHDLEATQPTKVALDYYDSEHIWMFKPILRKISDLDKVELKEIIAHIFRDSKMPNPSYESIECSKDFITFYDNDTNMRYVAVKPGYSGMPVMNMSNSFNDYEVFFKLHIDMFNLIGDGLATDINTI